ncbi:hypothetical protein Dda_3604 [Drechslerella dactyloides]|uniref:Uncharacterized protein n=1 Tax=Drechslerella dactyloides TaxID=74499 RepID=A0AAD6IY87_DREDA|nr:hypothetical protein Dda_3604 [Drechslerella dactyloides]
MAERVGHAEPPGFNDCRVAVAILSSADDIATSRHRKTRPCPANGCQCAYMAPSRCRTVAGRSSAGPSHALRTVDRFQQVARHRAA